MTITYPRDLPAWFLGMTQCAFTLDYLQEQDPTGDGDQLVRDVGPTLWNLDCKTQRLQSDKMGEMEAWVDSLENGGQPFWGYDWRRLGPLAYPNGIGGLSRAGGGTFDGTCTLGTVAGDNKSVPLTGLPVGFVLSPFDNLAFPYASGTRQALHRIVAGGVADGSGHVTVEVRPHVRVGWASGATVNLVKPSCIMKLVPGSYSPAQDPRGPGFVSFKAKQTLKVPA